MLSEPSFPSASRPGSKGSLVFLLTAREGGGGWQGLQGSQLRERTGPASGKSLCLSVKARLGGGDTNRFTGQRRGLLPKWSLELGESLWPSSDLTNPLTIHHLQQLVWLRNINSPSDRRCLCRFSNKPPGHDPSLSSIYTAAYGPLPGSGPSWAQQAEEYGQHLLLALERGRGTGGSGCLLC